MDVKEIREALESLVKGKDCGTFEVSCEADNEDELQAKVDATDDLWRFAHKALALIDVPVASDARELSDKIAEIHYLLIDGTIMIKRRDAAASLIESFAAERERKAREETARKCADNYCRSVCAWPSTEWKHPDECECAQRSAIMEAALSTIDPEAIKREAITQFRMDELDAVMHSIDKWFKEGDSRLKDNPATRAANAREIALKAMEATKRACADAAVKWINEHYVSPGVMRGHPSELRAAILQAEPTEQEPPSC